MPEPIWIEHIMRAPEHGEDLVLLRITADGAHEQIVRVTKHRAGFGSELLSIAEWLDIWDRHRARMAEGQAITSDP
jgi:hypothetical protein